MKSVTLLSKLYDLGIIPTATIIGGLGGCDAERAGSIASRAAPFTAGTFALLSLIISLWLQCRLQVMPAPVTAVIPSRIGFD